VDKTTETERLEEKTTWESYVKQEVNALLNTFLPFSASGNVGIKYIHPIKVQYEGAEEYDLSEYTGVEIHLMFNFESPLKQKPKNNVEKPSEETNVEK